MTTTDVKTSGGWLNLKNSRIARWLVVGALAISGGGGVSAIYGLSQGAQASWYCEGALTSVTKGTVSYSCLNPLPNDQSGAVLGVPTNVINVAANTAPATRLNICTAASASTACSGDTAGISVGSGILLEGAKRQLSISQTGTTLATAGSHGTPFAVLAPRNYGGTAKRYLNFTLQRGSGATVSGNPSAFVRFEVVPCNLAGVGC